MTPSQRVKVGDVLFTYTRADAAESKARRACRDPSEYRGCQPAGVAAASML